MENLFISQNYCDNVVKKGGGGLGLYFDCWSWKCIEVYRCQTNFSFPHLRHLHTLKLERRRKKGEEEGGGGGVEEGHWDLCT